MSLRRAIAAATRAALIVTENRSRATYFGAPLAADAQKAGKVHRIGYLTIPSRETAQDVANAFQRGLRDLGWVQGENVVVDHRFADGNYDRLPDLAAELVHLRVDVIVAGATAAVTAAKNATKTIPIVMLLAFDPVGVGLVGSLGRPGGNITGLTGNAGPEIYGKQLELLKDRQGPRPHDSAVAAAAGG